MLKLHIFFILYFNILMYMISVLNIFLFLNIIIERFNRNETSLIFNIWKMKTNEINIFIWHQLFFDFMILVCINTSFIVTFNFPLLFLISLCRTCKWYNLTYANDVCSIASLIICFIQQIVTTYGSECVSIIFGAYLKSQKSVSG